MSQTTLTQPADQFTPVRPDFERSEFDYRPVPALAPASLFMGIASFVALVGFYGLLVALITILMSAVAIVQIRRSRGELSGDKLAMIGLALSSVFLFTGSYFLYSDYVTELPPGYQRVNFPMEIAAKQFVVTEGQLALHPDVEKFRDRKIFVKGYMWQSRQPTGLTSFVLLKDNGECCFGGDPKPYDMMEVRMQDGKTVNDTPGLVGVAGVLRCNLNAGPGEPVYVLEAEHFDRARTVFGSYASWW